MAAPWRMFTMLRGTNASFTSTGKTSSACGVNALGLGSLAFPRAFWTSLVFMGSVGSATLAVASKAWGSRGMCLKASLMARIGLPCEISQRATCIIVLSH